MSDTAPPVPHMEPMDPASWDRSVFDALDALNWLRCNKSRASFTDQEIAALVSRWRQAGCPKPAPVHTVNPGPRLPDPGLICPRCGSGHVHRNGSKGGEQRYHCRGCWRYFFLRDGVPWAQTEVVGPPCPDRGGASRRAGVLRGRQGWMCKGCGRRFRP